MAAVVGLIGAVIGGLALARSAGRIGTGNGQRGAVVALVMGPIGLVMGGLVVATADGGLGTGNGLGGGGGGDGSGGDRHGPRRAGSGPLPPPRLTPYFEGLDLPDLLRETAWRTSALNREEV